MAIPFSCPHCQLETLVAEEFVGQSGACAACGKRITVPFLADQQSLDPNEVVVGIPYRGKSVWTILMVVAVSIVAVVAAMSIFGALVFPAVTVVRTAAHKHRCTNNLEKIAQALQLYEADHGSLPPAFVADEKGRPIHSWRVLILPYLGESGLSLRYDFNEPWDSAKNIQLTKLMPSVYACPADPDSRTLGESNYLVVVGSRTLFPGRDACSTSDITDELRTTLAVVESPARGTAWTQPADLPVENMQFMINGEFGKEIGSQHDAGAYVLMADGRVRFLSELLPADYAAGMATIAGGEPIPAELLD
jgi:hypothetical protein